MPDGSGDGSRTTANTKALPTRTLVFAWLSVAAIWLAYPWLLLGMDKLGKLTGMSININDYGTTGDAFGALNTLFSGLAFASIVITLFLQRQDLLVSQKALEVQQREMADSRGVAIAQQRALERQAFEATLFSWLEVHRQNVAAFRLSFKPSPIGIFLSSQPDVKAMTDTGISALVSIWEMQVLWRCRNEFGFIAQDDDTYIDMDVFREMMSRDDAKITPDLNAFLSLQESYKSTYGEHEHNFDRYYRTLFRILRWILQADLSIKEKRHYLGLVRAQLTWVERAFLMYQCKSGRADRFMRVAELSALFVNMGRRYDLGILAMRAHGELVMACTDQKECNRQYDSKLEGPSTDTDLGIPVANEMPVVFPQVRDM